MAIERAIQIITEPEEYFRDQNYHESNVSYFEQDKRGHWTLVARYANYNHLMDYFRRTRTFTGYSSGLGYRGDYHRIRFFPVSRLQRTGRLNKPGFLGFDPDYLGVKRQNRPPADIESLSVTGSGGDWRVRLDIGSHGIFDFSCKTITLETRLIRYEYSEARGQQWFDSETDLPLVVDEPFSN